MIQQVFTGGHFSSGTRVIQFLLEQTHNIYSTSVHKDYEPGFSMQGNTFGERAVMGEPIPLEGATNLREPFALKNPDFMMATKTIKKQFPKSKFILVVRNGLDQILCDNRAMFHRYARYFGLPRIMPWWKPIDFFKSEMTFWNIIHQYALSEGNIDLVIRLEDLVNDTDKTVQKIVDLLDIPYPDTSMVKKPDSMGRYKYGWTVPDTHGYRPEELKNIKYDPEMIGQLMVAGQESMKSFGYEIL